MFLDLSGDLAFVGFGFLEADNICLDLVYPIKKALLHHSTDAVHVPTDELHRPTLSSDIVNNDVNS